MRILTAGFDHARSERLGERLSAAGHSVLSASGASSCRTLAGSVTCDLLLVPEGRGGEDAQGWASDLLEGVPVLSLGERDDPVACVDAARPARPRSEHATEQLDEDALMAVIAPPSGATEHHGEAAILASIVADSEPLRTLPAPPPPEALAPQRRVAALRSAAVGPSLSSKVHDVRFGDYHAILEVQPGASTYVVRQQYDALKALYTPSGWHEALGPADIDTLDEIGQGLDDAFSILGHATYQPRYEAALETNTNLRA